MRYGSDNPGVARDVAGLGDGTPMPMAGGMGGGMGGGGGGRAGGYMAAGQHHSQLSQGGDFAGMQQTFGSLSLGSGSQSQPPYNLPDSQTQQMSLSQDFALTSSQEELYRFGDVWGAGPSM